MTELERRDRVEDLHRQAESMRFLEEELEQIDLGTLCLNLFCSLWEANIPTVGRHHL